MKVKQRFPWIPVSAAAAVLVVGVVAWLQIPAVIPAVKTGAPMPILGFTRPDSDSKSDVLAEQLAAYDPTPLFLPTPMNSGQKMVSFGDQANASGPFSDLAPRLVFSPDKDNITFPPIVAVPAGPVQGLTLSNRREVPLAMGRTDDVGKQLPPRAGYLEAVRSVDNRVVLTLSLPETVNRPEADWQPMELLGAVSSFGLVGDLAVTVSSGSDVVDDYFSAQLTRTVRVGDRLPPGFYTFRIGP
ncbi:MAG TPA: hypothetical protein VL357_08610 [Rariglobus sp.]|jgi:hypothetical protein|nr:hypothetical protein [Rariglobus sp.]